MNQVVAHITLRKSKRLKILYLNLRQLFLRHVTQTSDLPLMLEIEKAEGCYLFDKNGKRYLDLISGISVSGLGHRHPAVVKAAKEQLDRYLHTLVYGEYILSPQVKLAQLLCQHLPEPLDNVYFVNSGSEATEGAMKLAKRYTGRSEIIACRNAYHGSTQGAASLMSPTTFTQAFHPLLPVKLPISHTYRSRITTTKGDATRVMHSATPMRLIF